MSAAQGKRVVLVTGASRGIGAGLLSAFQTAGYAVVGTARSIPPSDREGYLTVAGDITEQEAAEHVIAEALDRFGRLDTVVNNAGLFIAKPFTECTAADLAAIVAVNLSGFFNITRCAIGQMVDQGAGHILNITTSIVDRPSSESPATLVALTKGGLAAATRSLAIEYASHGVRVNAIAPGIVRTPEHDPASYEGLAELHPLARLAEIDDIADAALYLDRATFVTGETLHVDGGQAAGR